MTPYKERAGLQAVRTVQLEVKKAITENEQPIDDGCPAPTCSDRSRRSNLVLLRAKDVELDLAAGDIERRMEESVAQELETQRNLRAMVINWATQAGKVIGIILLCWIMNRLDARETQTQDIAAQVKSEVEKLLPSLPGLPVKPVAPMAAKPATGATP